jgi:3'(2'), 5'-bisphosphate nucleotidase
LILPLWKSGLAVDAKSDDSPVTEADRRAEAQILDHLGRCYPDVPVLSEEHASAHGLPQGMARAFFLVDPLDGTKAFIRGDPHFTVNVALVVDGTPIAGAVTAPATGETWHTTSEGVTKRSKAGASHVHARRWPNGAAIALISHTMKPEGLASLQRDYGFASHMAMDSSIKLCRIAEGAADIYVRTGPTMEWDIAAGHAVLAAAGGRLTRLDGAPFTYGKVDEGFRNGPFLARGA